MKKVVNSILFGLALLTAVARMTIRFHHFQKNLRSDDYALLFACSCLIASQVLLYILKIDNIYWFAAVMFESSRLQTEPHVSLIFEDDDPSEEAIATLYRRISIFQRMQISMGILTWTCIFAVKICFLLFFRQLVPPSLRKLIVAWRVILAITIIFWAFCCCAFFISCSHFGKAICKLQFLPFLYPKYASYLIKAAPNQSIVICTRGQAGTRSVALSIMAALLDISSDLLRKLLLAK